MRILRTVLRAGVILVCLVGARAWAQSTDDCYQLDNLDLTLSSCSKLIQSGTLSGQDLANVYVNRGSAYYEKGDDDHAIQDYDQAIRIDPSNVMAFEGRGNAYSDKGDYDRAIQDFNQAIKLNPTYGLAFYTRGFAYDNKGDYDRAIQDYDQTIRLLPNATQGFDGRAEAYDAKGDREHAIQDFTQAIVLDPSDARGYYGRGVDRFCLAQFEDAQKDFAADVQLRPKTLYNPLWLYLAQARGGDKSAQSNLATATAGLDLKPWPGPIVELYLGTATPDTVLSAAKDPDPDKAVLQLCAAYFFLAERALLAGNKTGATGLFQQALSTGATSQYWAIAAAKAELGHLAVQPGP